MDDVDLDDNQGSEGKVAELERTVAELEHRFNRLRGFLDAVSSGYWDWNIATGEVDFSDNWLAGLGYAREDCNGRVDFWEKCVHPDDMPRVFRKVQEHFQKQVGFYSCENRLRTKSGEYRPNVDSGLVVEWDDEGKPLRMVGTDTDLSKIRGIEAELRKARHELELKVEARTQALRRTNDALARSNEELRRFASAASHDLQEPLRQVVSFAQLIQDQCRDGADNQITRHAEFMVGAAKRMREMVRSLLEYARCDRELVTAPCDFVEIVEDVLRDLATRITETGANVQVTGRATVAADRAGIQIILHNLVLNALKYAGHEAPKIWLCVDENAEQWVVACSDDGLGIAPEYREKVFDLFQRLHPQDQIPGSGMGLATARRIVEAHGGKLWIEDAEQPGCRFVFSIPKPPHQVKPDWNANAG